MTSNFFNKYESLVIGTGNILENEEFKKAKNPTQEVSIRHMMDTEIEAAVVSCFARTAPFSSFSRDKNF